MENKFILRVQFNLGNDVLYVHYVLDTKYYHSVFTISDLKYIPEIKISEDSFKKITFVSSFNICNNMEV